MSISISNILPSRTRSGRRVDPVAVKPVPVVAPLSNPIETPTEASRVKLLEWSILMNRSAQLYRAQFEYLNEVGDRSKKFSLMTEFTQLSKEIQEFVQKRRDSPNDFTYSCRWTEVAHWTELICWKSRMSVFNQAVCVA